MTDSRVIWLPEFVGICFFETLMVEALRENVSAPTLESGAKPTTGKKQKQQMKFDFSDEGESNRDPTPTLLIQVIGGKSSGKTTGALKLARGRSVVGISFDGETKPIINKLRAIGFFSKAWTKKGDRYMWLYDEEQDLAKYVTKEQIPAAAAVNYEYLKALLDPVHYDNERPDIVLFDDAATLEKLCDQAARHKHKMGYDQPTQNPSFWNNRNQNLRDLLILAESLAKHAVVFATGYEYDHNIKNPEPDDIKGEWTRRTDIVFHALAKRRGARNSDEISVAHMFETLSCKRDDQIVATGHVFDMDGNDFPDFFDVYFEKMEAENDQ